MLVVAVGGIGPPSGGDEGPFWLEMAIWELARNGRRFPWKQRLWHIWHIIRCGEPYLDFAELTLEDAERLRDWISEAVSEGTGAPPQRVEPLQAVNTA